jgi:hypothetical protein
MIKKYLEYVSILPIAVLIVYVVGYLTLSSYLQSISISDAIEFDTKLIKVGILSLFVTLPVILFTFLFNPTAKYDEPNPTLEIVANLFDAYCFIMLFSYCVYNAAYKGGDNSVRVFGMVYLICLLILSQIYNKVALAIKYATVLIILILLIFIATFMTKLPQEYYYFLNQHMLFFGCCIFHIFNKKGFGFQLSRTLVFVLAYCGCVSIFGTFCLVNIKPQFGGENSSSAKYLRLNMIV